ncbi:MAG: glycosyltransferase [Kofleriaceae bacterium]|nr:glycosyltransferase [Kofleriaceae bacterium]
MASLGKQGDFRCVQAGDWTKEEQEAATYIVDTLNLAEFSEVVRTRVAGQKFVLLVHHLASLEPGASDSFDECTLEKAVLPLFDGFIATSQYTADILAEYGLGNRVFVGEPAIEEVRSPVRELSWPPRALMASNLIPRKGVLAFLQSLSEFASHETCFSLNIVGRTDMDKEYSSACANLLQKYNLGERVRILGPVPYREMRAQFETADVYLSSSRMETFGIALQEARYFGLPIFAVDGGNCGRHVTPGITGELYESPEELAESFASIASHEIRLQRYFGQAQAGRPMATESWDGLAVRLCQTIASWC